jgi:hypothetical protein
MKKQLLLIICLFAFTLKAQTSILNIQGADSVETNTSLITQFKVYTEDCKIFFSFSKEIGSKENLVLDVFDINEKLVATYCLKCCQFIDASDLVKGNYRYKIKSGNEILTSGKLLLN